MSLSILREMLTYCRPYGTREDEQFRQRYLLNLPGAQLDIHGNIHIEIGTGSRVLWSSHTDTVHREPGRQTVHCGQDRVIRLSKRSKRSSSCLGADDTVGVYLMREMILRGVAGYYIFHFGEEVGGIGSSGLAKTHADFLSRFDFAIALDRANFDDVITHQWGIRTCSKAFAEQLAAALNQAQPMFRYEPSDGVYTDTAEYAAIIPECTNLSVGYFRQHGVDERVEFDHVELLLAALCALDPSDWIASRDPDSIESEYDDPQFDPRSWNWAGHHDSRFDIVVPTVRNNYRQGKSSIATGGYCPVDQIDFLSLTGKCPLCNGEPTTRAAAAPRSTYLDPALDEIMELNDYEVCVYPKECYCSLCRDELDSLDKAIAQLELLDKKEVPTQ